MLKERAIEFFLKDKNLQAFLNINSYLQVLEFVKDILRYDYYDQKKYNDHQKITLDIFLTSPPKECNNNFIACVEIKKIDEILGGHSIYDFFGIYMSDLGQEVGREIAVAFYIFLAVEIIDFKNEQIIKNRKVLNLLEYRVGLH